MIREIWMVVSSDTGSDNPEWDAWASTMQDYETARRVFDGVVADDAEALNATPEYHYDAISGEPRMAIVAEGDWPGARRIVHRLQRAALSFSGKKGGRA